MPNKEYKQTNKQTNKADKKKNKQKTKEKNTLNKFMGFVRNGPR
jgi:hypothetical protein